jgi:hypothetical protein
MLKNLTEVEKIDKDTAKTQLDNLFFEILTNLEIFILKKDAKKFVCKSYENIVKPFLYIISVL